MNPMLTAKKDALLKLIKERDMKDFFTIRDAGDESTTFFDARETLKNGKKFLI